MCIRDREKHDGLLVAYAPIADSLEQALGEYTLTDRETRPVGRNIAEAAATMLKVLAQLDSCTAGFDWRARLARPIARAAVEAVVATAAYLRDPARGGSCLLYTSRCV